MKHQILKTMKKSIIILSLMISTFAATAQETEKHEIRAGISDAAGITIGEGLVNVLSNAIVSGLTGVKIKDTKNKTLGMFELGYRYRLSDRIKVGADLSYLQIDKSYQRTIAETTTKYTRRGEYLLVLPTAEFAYIKTPLLTFYGTAAAGVLIGRDKELSSGKRYGDNSLSFAFQVNPIGLRVGKKIGAFAELGFGHKGIATAGISFRF
jgi:hypothetical protein